VAHPTVAVFEYHLVCYRRTWRETVFSSFVTPILLFIGLGTAVGAYVDGRSTLGLPYLAFIAPGMLAFTAMQVGLLESGYQVQSYMAWDRIYHGMAAAPLRVLDIIAGQLVYIALRVLAAVLAFLAVMAAFGAVRSPMAVAAPVVAVLVGLAAAAPMFAYAASVDGPYLMAVIRFCTLPVMFFSGVVFPVAQLPGFLQPVAYPLPLWHAVELCRAAVLGTGTAWPVPAHIGVLLAWIVVGLALARRQFARQLSE
jgi:lipooligosaccharide transport system permease protein